MRLPWVLDSRLFPILRQTQTPSGAPAQCERGAEKRMDWCVKRAVSDLGASTDLGGGNCSRGGSSPELVAVPEGDRKLAAVAGGGRGSRHGEASARHLCSRRSVGPLRGILAESRGGEVVRMKLHMLLQFPLAQVWNSERDLTRIFFCYSE